MHWTHRRFTVALMLLVLALPALLLPWFGLAATVLSFAAVEVVLKPSSRD